MVVCKNCGSESPDGTLYCPKCNGRLAQYTEEESKAYIASLQSDAGSPSSATKDSRRTGSIIVASIVGALVLLVAVAAALDQPTSTPTPTATPTPIPSLDTSPEMQAKRAAFIEDCIERGIFQKVEKPAKYPHVWVTPIFHALDFDDKEAFVNVVYAYYIAQDSTCDLAVLYDSKTGKKVGVFAEVYAGLKLE